MIVKKKIEQNFNKEILIKLTDQTTDKSQNSSHAKLNLYIVCNAFLLYKSK